MTNDEPGFWDRHPTLSTALLLLAVIIIFSVLASNRSSPPAASGDPYDHYDQYDEPASGPHGAEP